jgi:hypothetical protein
MTATPIITKMRALAAMDATLQSYLYNAANNTFRFFDTQMPPGYIQQGTCVTARQISTVSMYAQNGRLATDQPRVQIDVRDLDSAKAKKVAAAIDDWLGTVSFMSDAQFTSPPTTPPNFACFKLNQRSSEDFAVQPIPAWIETLEYRIFSNLNN